jgi:PAS domain S-box-containing protein
MVIHMIAPKPRDEERRLRALEEYHILDTPPEPAFDDIARLAAHICQTPIAVINFIDRDRQWFKAEVGLGTRETPLLPSICAHAILQDDLVLVHDTLADDRFRDNPFVVGTPHLRFYAGAVISSHDGQPIGTMCVLDYVPREMTKEQAFALQALARQVMAQLELRRKFDEQERTFAEFRRLQRQVMLQGAIAQLLADSESVSDATRRTMERVARTFHWDIAVFWERDWSTNVMVAREFWTESQRVEPFERATRGSVFKSGEGLPGAVWQMGGPFWIEELPAAKIFARASVASHCGLRSGVGFPVTTGGKIYGVFEFFSFARRAEDPELAEVVKLVGQQFGQFWYRRAAEGEVLRVGRIKSAVLEVALDAVITMNHLGRVVEFNPAAEKLFGYEREKALGKEMAELIIPPELRERHRQGLTRYLETGEGPVLRRRIEVPAMRADGTTFPAELAIIPIPEMKPPLFTGFLRDVTERKQHEAALREANESIRQHRAIAALLFRAPDLLVQHGARPPGAAARDAGFLSRAAR